MSRGHLMKKGQNFSCFENYVESCVCIVSGEVEVEHSSVKSIICMNLDQPRSRCQYQFRCACKRFISWR